MIDLLILLSTSFVNLVLAGLVFLSNRKSLINRKFIYVIAFFVLWTCSNYFADNIASLSLLFSRLTFVAALGIAYSMLELSSVFPTGKNVMSQRVKRTLNTGLLLIGVVCLTPLIVVSSVAKNGGAELVVGTLYNLYIAAILATLIVVVYNFFQQRKSSNVAQKAQIKYLVIGLIAYVSLAVSSQLIVPIVYDSWASSRFGPVFTMVFIGFTTLAIVKHRLLDIRSFAIRALVYLLSIAFVAVVYTSLVFVVGGFVIDLENVSVAQRAFFAIAALLIALTYTPIVKFFNKATTTLFFRDAYDTQEVLDQIGKIIVGSIDLHKIQKSSLGVLLEALRPLYGGFVLKSPSGGLAIQDFVGEVPKFNEQTLALIVHKVGKNGASYDELADANSELAQHLRSNDISLIVPLITKNETIGYFVTGPKKSGNVFNQQDKSMITIVANELAVALQNAQRFEEIKEFNLTLQAKVDDATKELKKTNRKLVELDEAKDEFISMASHQLRTPLTSIKGYLSMLMDGDLGKVSKEQDQALKEAFTSSQRMVFLISDFLNVSRIKTGKFVIEPKEVDLGEMVREEMVQLKEMAESKSLSMSYDPPADFPLVKLDENKMHQVMMNMMDNAIYYTPNNGSITAQLYLDGKDVVFKVVDTGIGVPKAEQHKLFTKFFRAANARKTRPDGTGLGLFMAQKVVLAQGGSIIFESEEGKGSTFGFRFPLAAIKA